MGVGGGGQRLTNFLGKQELSDRQTTRRQGSLTDYMTICKPLTFMNLSTSSSIYRRGAGSYQKGLPKCLPQA